MTPPVLHRTVDNSRSDLKLEQPALQVGLVRLHGTYRGVDFEQNYAFVTIL